MKPLEDISSTPGALIEWAYPEYTEHERTNRWYLWYGIAAALLVAIAIIGDNYLFAVIILLFSVILFLQNWRKPHTIRITITGGSFFIDGKPYSMKDFASFWLAYDPPHVERLYLQSKSSLRPTLSIPLNGTNPLDVRTILLDYIDEDLEREDELTSDMLARLLKL